MDAKLRYCFQTAKQSNGYFQTLTFYPQLFILNNKKAVRLWVVAPARRLDYN